MIPPPGPITPDLYGDLVETASKPGYAEWLSMVKATGGCAEPIHLWGGCKTVHAATGEVLAERPTGRLMVACGNRRARRCPSCSETYRADTYQLIRAGLVGGKTVPEGVAAHPRVFATFTAPSFGAVHHHVVDDKGGPKRCHPGAGCNRRHDENDPLVGQPLDPTTYDYEGAVMWNALATRLWARTVQLVNRKAAALLRIAQRDWSASGRVSVAKVAEYQARGLVHFHAIFRLDGPEQTDEPPAGASVELLTEAIRCAASAARIDSFRPAVWGDQLDLRPIQAEEADGRLSDTQVAGYVAKYATKGAETTGTIDRPLYCRACAGQGCHNCGGTGARHSIDALPLPPHAKAMIATCWALGGRPELAFLRLRPWAHTLGFRGHFATKSRRYSTTLGCLRMARRNWRLSQALHAHDLDPDTTTIGRVTVGEEHGGDETVLVIGNWMYTGRGHSPGEAIYAATIAHDLAEARRLRRLYREEELI